MNTFMRFAALALPMFFLTGCPGSEEDTDVVDTEVPEDIEDSDAEDTDPDTDDSDVPSDTDTDV